MKPRLMYVELKPEHMGNGPAWIGKAQFSRTGTTVYFNGSAFKKSHSRGGLGNYYEISTGDTYWISGVKKEGSDRLWSGGPAIMIDKSCVQEYLDFVGYKSLNPKDYQIVELDNTYIKEEIAEYENSKIEDDGFERSLYFKKLHDLSDDELLLLEKEYREYDFTLTHKKHRKNALKDWDNCQLEIQKRGLAKD